jgi:hypothetical protein
LKQDAEELRDIAKGPGTMGDQAKRAADALKEPGAKRPGQRRRPNRTRRLGRLARSRRHPSRAGGVRPDRASIVSSPIRAQNRNLCLEDLRLAGATLASPASAQLGAVALGDTISPQ